MTDSEIRAAIRETVDDSVLTHTGRSIGDLASEHVADDLVDLLKAQLTAERTAIKALLPKKDHLPDGVTPVEIAKRLDDFNRGRNSVIDQVTQVIDGREGV